MKSGLEIDKTLTAAPRQLLEPDRNQIEQFVDALFRHCGKEGFVSFRSFFDNEISSKPFLIEAVPTNVGFKYLVDVAEDHARRAANDPKRIVFCPPIAVFNNKGHAAEMDLLAGLALSVECDQHPKRARAKLERILGPATAVVRSGGEWQPSSGLSQSKLHLHFRLMRAAQSNEELAKLKRLRRLAVRLVAGDASNVPIVHPIRWPGSWHRKREPRLCEIEALEPDREIDLDAAIAALETALPGKDRKGNSFDHDAGQQQYDGHDGDSDHERPDWAELTANIVAGKDLHDSTMRLAASYVGAGMKPEHALRQLQAIMLASAAPHDERWKARFNDLGRLVNDGQAKFGESGQTTGAGKGVDEIDLAKIFTFLGDEPHAPPRELINGLIPAEGVAVTGGQSTAGKTFIEIYKSICLATATPYFGRKIIERVGTVFVAAEGRPLLPNRFAAALIKLSIEAKLPITWPRLLPDFSCAEGIKLFIRQLKAIDECYRGDFGVRLGRVPIDTVAATFGMKDEDDNAEATKVCNVLRSIGGETGALMAPIHHYGKNPESGLRGASAWKGSADVIEGVLADIDPLTGRTSNRELVCTKARDGEQGPIAPFDLEFIELGLKDDGEVYGSCCVVPSTREQSRFQTASAQSKSKRAILGAINEAIDGLGKIIVPRVGMPQVRGAKVNDIRKEFDRLYVVDGSDPIKIEKAKQKAFRRAIDCLAPAKFGAGSCEGADWIWKI
jgi:hypothetical protein